MNRIELKEYMRRMYKDTKIKEYYDNLLQWNAEYLHLLLFNISDFLIKDTSEYETKGILKFTLKFDKNIECFLFRTFLKKLDKSVVLTWISLEELLKIDKKNSLKNKTESLLSRKQLDFLTTTKMRKKNKSTLRMYRLGAVFKDSYLLESKMSYEKRLDNLLIKKDLKELDKEELFEIFEEFLEMRKDIISRK